MDINSLANKTIALLLINTEAEDDMHVYVGKIEKSGEEYYFTKNEKEWNVTLNEEQLSRLQVVKKEVKEIFMEADYFIPLYVGNLTSPSKDDIKLTGLKWD